MDTSLLLLFITFILLVIADYFLTHEGVVRRGYPEIMYGRKELMKKCGNEKGSKISSLIMVGFGIFVFIFFSVMEYFNSEISEIHLAGIIIFVIFAVLLLTVVIIDVVHLLKVK